MDRIRIGMTRKVAIGTLVKDAISGESQAHGFHGHFASGSEAKEQVGEKMTVHRDDIKVGDVIEHKSGKFNGGKVIEIIPPKEGAEAKGPKFRVQFAGGHKDTLFMHDQTYNVVRGGVPIHEPAAGAAVGKPLGGGNKPGGAEKPAGAGKPEAAAPKLPTGPPKEYSLSHSMNPKDIQVGDRIMLSPNSVDALGPSKEPCDVLGVKPVPGGNREITYAKSDGSVGKITLGSKQYGVFVQAAHDKLDPVSERNIALSTFKAPDGVRYGFLSSHFNSLQVGDAVKLGGSEPKDVVGIRDMGSGRRNFYLRSSDGSIIMRSYTAKEAQQQWLYRSRLLNDDEWKKYSTDNAEKIKADKEAAEKVEAEAKVKAAAEEAARQAAKVMIDQEADRAAGVKAAFEAGVAEKIAASEPVAPLTAGDVRNGGIGGTNAELAERCGDGQLEQAKMSDYIAVKAGACNMGLYCADMPDGSQVFVKQVETREIGNEVLASLIAQRIGLNMPAAIPAYRDTKTGVVTTDPSKLPAGQEFNALAMTMWPRTGPDGSQIMTGGKVADYNHPDYALSVDPEQSQKLALFDALVGNSDRHDDNIYVSPDLGIMPFDNGLSLGTLFRKIGFPEKNTDDSAVYLKSNYATKDLMQLTAMTSHHSVGSAEGDQYSVLSGGALQAMPIMNTSEYGATPDSSVFTPTSFAAGLKDNVQSAVADYQRSYENPSLGIHVRDSASGLGTPKILSESTDYGIRSQVSTVSGGGVSLISAALDQMMTEPMSSKISMNDPNGVFSPASIKKALRSALLKIGTLRSAKVPIGRLMKRGHDDDAWN